MSKKWFVSVYEDALAEGDIVEADTAAKAAENWVDDGFADLDYPSHLHVYVSDGKTEQRYLVDVYQTPSFSAQLDPPPHLGQS